MSEDQQEHLPGLGEFLAHFLRSFRKWFVVGLLPPAFSLGLYFGLLALGARSAIEPRQFVIQFLALYAPLMLFMSFCIAWAGAIRKSIPHTIKETISFGATILAVTFALGAMAWGHFGEPVSPLWIVAAALGIFFFAWVCIAMAWSSLGFFDQRWW